MKTEHGSKPKKQPEYPSNVTGRVNWLAERFPDFQVTEDMVPYLTIAELNTPLDGPEVNAGDEVLYITVKNPQHLIDFKPITHPSWLEDWDFCWPDVVKDVEKGKTFCFYWLEDRLAWER